MKQRLQVESSGNVFADLSLPKADELLVKAELVARILDETERRRLTQSQAAALLESISQRSPPSSKGGCPGSPSSVCCASFCSLGGTLRSRSKRSQRRVRSQDCESPDRDEPRP